MLDISIILILQVFPTIVFFQELRIPVVLGMDYVYTTAILLQTGIKYINCLRVSLNLVRSIFIMPAVILQHFLLYSLTMN